MEKHQAHTSFWNLSSMIFFCIPSRVIGSTLAFLPCNAAGQVSAFFIFWRFTFNSPPSASPKNHAHTHGTQRTTPKNTTGTRKEGRAHVGRSVQPAAIQKPSGQILLPTPAPGIISPASRNYLTSRQPAQIGQASRMLFADAFAPPLFFLH